jgi:hypothetical protein
MNRKKKKNDGHKYERKLGVRMLKKTPWSESAREL